MDSIESVIVSIAIEFRKSFTIGELTEFLWQKEPSLFSFIGLTQDYPDIQKVSTYVSKLKRKKLLEKVGESNFALTKKGKNLAYSLKKTDNKSKFNDFRMLLFGSLLETKCFSHWVEGNKEKIKITDATDFWKRAGVDVHDKNEMDFLQIKMIELLNIMEREKALPYKGVLYKEIDVRTVLFLHEWMLNKFSWYFKIDNDDE